MNDPRYRKLAQLLVTYSTEVKQGDVVLVESFEAPDEFAIEVLREIRRAGGLPLIEARHPRLTRELLLGTDEKHASLIRSLELARIKKAQAYIGIRGGHNANENADVPSDRMSLYTRVLRPVLNHRVNHTRWVVLRWPTPSMAQAAGMSTEAFEDFYFQVCCMDYRKMARALAPLEKRMQLACEVQLTAPGTDLRFSIRGIGAKPCVGLRNIPDGEVFSCPVKDSVNGTIQYNTPTVYAGTRFENVRLVFKSGRIVEASANNTKRLNEILDTDEGARYVGEFSLGFNPHILQPMCDTLFDEKIAGSLHFTPGQAYEDVDNGNRSAIHWDLVLIQRPEWGGGEIWFDGELIRKNGLFVPKDLLGLNPNRLKQ
jgi:aminopeptidase